MKAAGLVLMGGKSSRMDGNPKAYLKYQEVCFYQRSAQAMEGSVPVYLSVSRSSRVPETEYPILYDRYENIGPMGGIISALELLDTEALLVFPCDMPLITGSLASALLDRWKEEGLPVAVKMEKRCNPLAAVYTQACLPVLKKMMEEKNYRISGWMDRMDFQILDLMEVGADMECLANINTMEDYHRLLEYGEISFGKNIF